MQRRGTRRCMDQEKNEQGDQHNHGDCCSNTVEQVSEHPLTSVHQRRGNTSSPTPKSSLYDDLAAEDATARVDLVHDVLGFTVKHLVPPHEARRRCILDCLE